MFMSYRSGLACAVTICTLIGGAAPPATAASGIPDPAAEVVSTAAEPHPELSGKRLQVPGNAPIYLVDPEGYRRHIPDPTTYDNLFRNWDGVAPDLHLSLVSERTALSSGAFLARVPGQPRVYLVSNGLKRWIVSPATMDKYYFDWKKVREIPALALDAVPEGEPWS
ncbi:hypothetical protein Areg01_74450 [Actinoplanes regularis]|nr:hypothetical protein Areg01_74450 [Actinoplanes regularis]